MVQKLFLFEKVKKTKQHYHVTFPTGDLEEKGTESSRRMSADPQIQIPDSCHTLKAACPGII